MRSQLAAMFLVFSLSANAQTLSGAIDMHAHSDPDGVPRKIDAVDLARLVKERGMRGIVLKNHYEPTASLAYIVRKDVPGIEVFGGISLDLTVGGVNPAAVESAILKVAVGADFGDSQIIRKISRVTSSLSCF